MFDVFHCHCRPPPRLMKLFVHPCPNYPPFILPPVCAVLTRLTRSAPSPRTHCRAYHSANPRDHSGPASAPVNAVQPLSSPSGQPRPAAYPAAAGPSPALVSASHLASAAAAAADAASTSGLRPLASHASTAAVYADPFTRPAISTESLAANSLHAHHPFASHRLPTTTYNRYPTYDDNAIDGDDDAAANADTNGVYNAADDAVDDEDDVERYALHRYLYNIGGVQQPAPPSQLSADDYRDDVDDDIHHTYTGAERNEWVQAQCRQRLYQLAAELF